MTQQTKTGSSLPKTIAPSQAINFRHAPGMVMFGANFTNRQAAEARFEELMGRRAHESELRFFEDSAAGKKEEARALEMIETGRQQTREGINDTGKSIYESSFGPKGMPGAKLEKLVSRLKGRTYLLKEMYLKENKKGNWAIKFVFVVPQDGQRTVYLPSQMDEITDYLSATFDSVHIYDNRYGGGSSITINFRDPGAMKMKDFKVKTEYSLEFKGETSYISWAFVATYLKDRQVVEQSATMP